MPETFFIASLTPLATDLGTAGYVIETSGRYVVTRDLTLSGLDIGILVLAGDVTIDLNGHSVIDASAGSTLVRIEGATDVAIHDGSLQGGAAGVTGERPDCWLTLRNLRIQGRGNGYAAVDLGTVKQIDIRDSEIRGGAVILRGSSFNSRIVNSRIEGAISVEGFGGGRILGNVIEGSVVVGGDLTVVRGNQIRADASAVAALTTLRGIHFIRDNEVIANGPDHALLLDGLVNASGNTLSGGEESTVALSTHESRISDNIIYSDNIGIAVSGSRNVVEGNAIGGQTLQCGISFETGPGHLYRNNTVHGAAEAYCGEPARDGGGNEISFTCPAALCDARVREMVARAVRRTASREERADLDDGNRNHVPRCEPGEVIVISEPRPDNTEHGSTALLIDAPGYYVVSRDLHLPEVPRDYSPVVDAGVLITSGDVTLDLAGHTIFAHRARVGALVAGGENVVIRNGEIQGGSDGLSLRGKAGSDATRVRLERMKVVEGPSSSYKPLIINDIDRIEVLDSILDGVDLAIRGYGGTTGRIAGSVITASEESINFLGFRDGILRDNLVSGFFLGGGNQIKRNLSTYGAALLEQGNTIVENFFDDRNGEALGLYQRGGSGSDLVIDNIVVGTASIESSGARLHGNTLSWGVRVSGTGTSLEDNLVLDAFHECGIEFLTEGSHRYRGNVVLEADEGICGHRNIDEGGNVLPETKCGNAIKAVSELCDGPVPDSCTDLGFEGGSVSCNATCDGLSTANCRRCGDGVRASPEVCDGQDLGGRTCVTEGLEEGTLACDAACMTLDTSGCRGCGNAIIEGDEVCDGPALGGTTCGAFGLTSGELRCNNDCSGFDLTSCLGCGNGIIEGSEQCDGSNLGGSAICQYFPFSGGPLSCSDDCKLDTSSCWWCGNGVAEGGEYCDGADLHGQSCQSLGKYLGTLSCTSMCTFNTSQCGRP